MVKESAGKNRDVLPLLMSCCLLRVPPSPLPPSPPLCSLPHVLFVIAAPWPVILLPSPVPLFCHPCPLWPLILLPSPVTFFVISASPPPLACHPTALSCPLLCHLFPPTGLLSPLPPPCLDSWPVILLPSPAPFFVTPASLSPVILLPSPVPFFVTPAPLCHPASLPHLLLPPPSPVPSIFPKEWHLNQTGTYQVISILHYIINWSFFLLNSSIFQELKKKKPSSLK